MSSLNKYLCIVFPLFLCCLIHAQEEYPYTAANKNCILKLGKYEMPLFERKPAYIAKEDFKKLDSIETCNCDFKIIQFEVNYTGAMGNVEFSDGSHFSTRSKKYFESVSSDRMFYISGIKVENKDGISGNIYPIALINDTIAHACICLYDNNITNYCSKEYKGENNPCSKALFLQFNEISLTHDIIDIKSFTIEIVSKDARKSFNIIGDTLTQEVKDYVWNTSSSIVIHIKNVIAGNDSSFSINAEGIDFQCKY